MPIHPTALIDKHAELDPTVEVGPYCIIERGVRIGAGTRLIAHVFVAAGTTLGQRNLIFPNAVLGHWPQDLAFKDEPSYTVIGDDNIIREGVTIHRGTMPGSTTHVGNRCFLMAYSHVGHNCHVSDDVKLANGALLAGHVQVGEKSFISGNAAVHQFVRIGELVMLAGVHRASTDVPPFTVSVHNRLAGLNIIGMRRAGFTSAERSEIKHLFRVLFRSAAPFRAALEQHAPQAQSAPARRMIEFLRAPTRRGIMRCATRARNADEPADDE